MTMVVNIRPATTADAAAIAAIYAHHVTHGTGSYDTEARSVAATASLIAEHHARGWPFLVALGADGSITGYAYASQFKPRAGYTWTCEDSIYIHPDQQGRGVGKALLASLVIAAETAGFRTMVAVIGGPNPLRSRSTPHAASPMLAASTAWAGSTAAGSTPSTCSARWATAPTARPAPCRAGRSFRTA